MATDLSPEQPEKASAEILLTELGTVIDVSPEQPEKAFNKIEVTELGIAVFLQPEIKELLLVSIMALQSSRES